MFRWLMGLFKKKPKTQVTADPAMPKPSLGHVPPRPASMGRVALKSEPTRYAKREEANLVRASDSTND